MSPPEKKGSGIPLNVELTRKEHDLLMLGAKKWKHTPQEHVRWLIEASGLGFFIYSEEGAAARSLFRANEAEIHYPDSVSVSISPIDDKE
jgi:hypothetical protein